MPELYYTIMNILDYLALNEVCQAHKIELLKYTPYNVWKNLFDDLKGLKQSEKNELLKKIYLENF